MKNDIAISVKNLSKQYKIGSRDPYITLRDVLSNPFAKREEKNTFWALKDVSFDVKQGEVVGVIGKNGSGKSTLLKILTRITPPTKGEAIIKGRVASLLEVGTGFNAELTGRENIFLNGAILGMTQKEIKRKFDEIVDFSGVEKFLDTPVKRYSSGMYVRLAFAVAAHLESEILLVDEVLAVGDVDFQKKCLGKMDDVAKSGRTVLFVSHQMSAIKKLCSKTIVLNEGKIEYFGSNELAIAKYLKVDKSDSVNSSSKYIKKVELKNDEGLNTETILAGEGGSFTIILDPNDNELSNLCITMVIYTKSGNPVTTLTNLFSDTLKTSDFNITKKTTFNCAFKNINLMPGLYSVNIALNASKDGIPIHDRIVNALNLSISPGQFPKNSAILKQISGVLILDQSWGIHENN